MSLANVKNVTSTLLVGLLFVVGTFFANIASVQAVHPQNAGWQPGRIIDDAIFTNNNAMSTGQIQSFLNTVSGSGSDCLKNYQTPAILGNNQYGNNVSAATAIKQAANLFKINPRVLLATLQKEQRLVLRKAPCPSKNQPEGYRDAMGFGCPDSAPCDAQWFGLSRQLYQGARHFRGFYDQSPGWWVPFTPGTRYIQYNPSTSCGGKNVTIQNRATASLYSYTPYQPNNATLAAAPGQTVTCGAYGNINFWRYYRQWFGPTYGHFASRIKGAGSSSTTMEVNTTKTVSVRYRNISGQAWYDSISYTSVAGARPVVLLALDPDRQKNSQFNASFSTPTRATEVFSKVYLANGTEKTSQTNVVQPNEVAEFTFTITAPPSFGAGEYEIAYQPVIPAGGGQPRINLDAFSTYYVTLTNPAPQTLTPTAVNSSDIPMTSKEYSATRIKGTGTSSTTMQTGTSKLVSVLLKNTGTKPWYDTASAPAASARPMVLLALHPLGKKDSGFNASFSTPTRATETIHQVYTTTGQLKSTTPSTRIVNPGEVARIAFTINAPADLQPGNNYRIAYTPVIPAGGGNPRISLAPSDIYYIALTP